MTNPQPAVRVDAREAIAALTPAPTEAGGVSVYRENLLEAWSALRMIREAIETIGPVGSLMSEEAVNAFIAPTFSGEAEALIAGIQKIAALSSTPAADAGKFKIGNPVRKTKGSRWQGRMINAYLHDSKAARLAPPQPAGDET